MDLIDKGVKIDNNVVLI